jgi:POT family proton-dependent oligopeptide transporter
MSHNNYRRSLKQKSFGHPVGLFILFLTEMWERFHIMGWELLVLYMTSSTLGDDARGAGLGWTSQEALALYGWYTMLVYIMSIQVWLRIGTRPKGRSFRSDYPLSWAWCFDLDGYLGLYTGLGLVIAGVGLLKPNISTMVGGLYPQGDIRRDKGFSIFYIGQYRFIVSNNGDRFCCCKWGHAGFGFSWVSPCF